MENEILKRVAHEILIDFGVQSMKESIGVLDVKMLMVKMVMQHVENPDGLTIENIVSDEQHKCEIKCIKSFGKGFDAGYNEKEKEGIDELLDWLSEKDYITDSKEIIKKESVNK